MFSTHMPWLIIIKICFTNNVNTTCGGGQLLVTGSQDPISRVPDVRVPCPRVLVSGSQGSKSQGLKVPALKGLTLRVSGSRVLGLRVTGPGFQVLILDYALKKCYSYNRYNLSAL